MKIRFILSISSLDFYKNFFFFFKLIFNDSFIFNLKSYFTDSALDLLFY
jgi:hypothetical protein